MNSSKLKGWVVGVGALVASAAFGAAVVGDVMAGNADAGAIESRVPGDAAGMREVLGVLADAGYDRVLEIERKRDGYEVEALDADGREVELYVNADGSLSRLDDSDLERDREDHE